MYADDGLFVKISSSRSRNQESIENGFCRIKNYLNTHGLQLNEAKTKLMEVMSKQKRTRLEGYTTRSHS